MSEREMITGINVPMSLKYCYTAGQTLDSFLRHVKEGRIVGQRCSSCTKVHVPPRGCCPKCGVAAQEEVEVSTKGAIDDYTIVHIPIMDSHVKPPFVAAHIRLDGADNAFLHLVSEVDNDQVHIGMRVEAVWKPRKEWGYTFENILHFRPIDEPDVDIGQGLKKVNYA